MYNKILIVTTSIRTTDESLGEFKINKATSLNPYPATNVVLKISKIPRDCFAASSRVSGYSTIILLLHQILLFRISKSHKFHHQLSQFYHFIKSSKVQLKYF